MKLTDLYPQFITYGERTITEDDLNPTPYQQKFMTHVDLLAEAQGLQFGCPKCFEKNGGMIGTHLIDVTFRDRGVSDNLGSHNTEGAPSRWAVSGTGYADLTIQPSVLVQGACGWHGFITNGEIISC